MIELSGAVSIFRLRATASRPSAISLRFPSGEALAYLAALDGKIRAKPTLRITRSRSSPLPRISDSDWITWSTSGTAPRAASPARGS